MAAGPAAAVLLWLGVGAATGCASLPFDRLVARERYGEACRLLRECYGERHFREEGCRQRGLGSVEAYTAARLHLLRRLAQRSSAGLRLRALPPAELSRRLGWAIPAAASDLALTAEVTVEVPRGASPLTYLGAWLRDPDHAFGGDLAKEHYVAAVGGPQTARWVRSYGVARPLKLPFDPKLEALFHLSTAGAVLLARWLWPSRQATWTQTRPGLETTVWHRDARVRAALRLRDSHEGGGEASVAAGTSRSFTLGYVREPWLPDRLAGSRVGDLALGFSVPTPGRRWNHAVAIAPSGWIVVADGGGLTVHAGHSGRPLGSASHCDAISGGVGLIDDGRGVLVCRREVRLIQLPALSASTLLALPSEARVAAFGPEHVAVALESSEVLVLGTRTLTVFDRFPAQASALALSLDGRRLAVGSPDGTILERDLIHRRSRTVHRPPPGAQPDPLRVMAYSPSGERLFRDGPGFRVRELDPTSGGVLATYGGPSWLKAAAYLTETTIAAAGSSGLVVYRRGESDPARLRDPHEQNPSAEGLAVSRGRGTVCAGDRGGRLLCYAREPLPRVAFGAAEGSLSRQLVVGLGLRATGRGPACSVSGEVAFELPARGTLAEAIAGIARGALRLREGVAFH